jgi:predicted cupin superfamily sugar epimerase
MLTAEQIIDLLGLKPLAREGGYYSETYRSDESLGERALPSRYGAGRDMGVAIHYLLTPDTFSALHRLTTDEIYHFYLGDPVDMLQLHPDGSIVTLRLGHNLLEGMAVQVVVKRGVWQGSRLAEGGRFALLGTTTAPGFDAADYEHGDRDRLIAAYPRARELIAALTR